MDSNTFKIIVGPKPLNERGSFLSLLNLKLEEIQNPNIQYKGKSALPKIKNRMTLKSIQSHLRRVLNHTAENLVGKIEQISILLKQKKQNDAFKASASHPSPCC